MTREELEGLREGWDFEAKLAAGPDGRGALPASLWETYSAMANTEGGVILLGAKERRDGRLELRGIPDIERVERDLWNTVGNPGKVSANLLGRGDVERIESGGSTCLLVRVPKAGRAHRPVHLDGSWERGTYLRVHDGDRQAGREVARRMLADSIPDQDGSAVEEFTLADLDPESVRRCRDFLAARRPDHPFLPLGEEELLVAIGAAARVRGGGPVRPTWAGLWMLGREISVRELQPHWHLSYKELPDRPDGEPRWLDRIHPDGTWNANLFQFYLRVILKLHEGLKVPFALEQGQFRVDETPVHHAVREALVNTLVHADHRGTTGLRIVRSRTRFEFINPGLLLVTPEQVWRGGVSEPRNPALQRLFGLLRLGEREGSGGPMMRRTWREQHWRTPRVWQDTEHCETHLLLPRESLLPEAAVAALVARWGGDTLQRQDELGRIILVTAEAEEGLQHARIRELSDAHPRDITLKLQELVRRGLLEATGALRRPTYRVRGPGAPAPSLNGGVPRPADQESEVESARPGRAPSEASATPSAASSTPSAASSTPNAASSEAIERVRKSRHAPAALVTQAIVEACARGYLTVAQIAQAVGRSESTVRIRFLPGLVRSGRLELLHAEAPHHPAQAYRTRGPSR